MTVSRQPRESNGHAISKRDGGSSLTKHNKVFAADSHDNRKRHSNPSQSGKEGISTKKDSGLQNHSPKTEVSAANGSRHFSENSQAALGCGLEESFASLRRSSATPDLLNTSSVFDPCEVPHISSNPSSAGTRTSSPRLRRPPTKESRSVSICETDVCILMYQFSNNISLLDVFLVKFLPLYTPFIVMHCVTGEVGYTGVLGTNI